MIHINWIAVLIAVVANFAFGALWYMPLFGRAWAKEMNYNMNGPKPPASAMAKGMLIMVIGNFLMVFVFAHNIAAWGFVPDTQSMSPMQNVMSAALFTWLGFFVPQDLGRIAWEKSSWKLFFINTAYHLLSLVIAALILIYMK